METRILTNEHPDYPSGMAMVELVGGPWARPAPALYLRGALPEEPGIAIVGTRKPTEEAAAFANELARAAVREGWSVWSGGAKGIDRAAHRGAIDAGGKTVVVTGGGHERPYPAANSDVFADALATGGALLSLYPDDTPAYRWTFKCRNIVLVALTRLTVVAQARKPPSGSMNAASAARRMGRPLLVVPGSPWQDATKGSALLLTRGAEPVVSVTHAMDVARRCVAETPNLAPLPPAALPAMVERGEGPATAQGAAMRSPVPLGSSERRAPPSAPDRSDDADLLLARLDGRGQTVDDLCERTGMAAARVQRALLILTLRGDLVEEGGCYRRRGGP